MKVLRKISDVLDKVCGVLIVVMLAAMVVLTSAQIVFRTWFTALSWSEEVTRYLLIWSTFLGSTCVYLHGGNIAITFVQDMLPAKCAKVLRVLVHVICLVLFVVVFHYGCRYCANLKKTATALPIKMKYIFLCIPISMAICAWHALVLAIEEMVKPAIGKEVKS